MIFWKVFYAQTSTKPVRPPNGWNGSIFHKAKRIVKTVWFWTDAGFQRQKSQRLRCTRTVTVSQSLCPTLGSWIRRTRGVRTANLIPIYLTHRGSTHQKEKLFKAWGYTVEDAAWLQEELEKQAVYKYSTGQYTLGRLNKDGQRINIRIDLDRKDGSGPVSFVSGWMVQPNGTLKLNTPYGGK